MSSPSAVRRRRLASKPSGRLICCLEEQLSDLMRLNGALRQGLQLGPRFALKRSPKDLGTISRKFDVSEKDMKEVNEQLGYNPTNLIEISARSSAGKPAAVKLYPLRNAENDRKVKTRATAEPFPTMYWLIDPELKIRISRLEDANWVDKLQEKLQEPQNLEIITRQHEEYAKERWDLLSVADLELVRRNKWERALNKDVGVAGIRNFGRVKCLHTHYAHYLATGGNNLIGSWVDKLLAQEK